MSPDDCRRRHRALQTAFGTLKQTGSRDPDILYAHKETMLAPYKNLKRLAIIGVAIGGLFTIMIFMAWFLSI